MGYEKKILITILFAIPLASIYILESKITKLKQLFFNLASAYLYLLHIYRINIHDVDNKKSQIITY